MDNSIYEVTRDEYAGFIGQLNKQMCDVEQAYQKDLTIMKIKSKKTGTHFCSRVIPQEGEEHYYVFNMPLPEERIAPKPVRQIKLETREEVQAFFDALSKLQRGEKYD